MAKIYKERNLVQLQENSRGYWQYQIPGKYAESIYGKRQKYISCGAKAGDIEIAAELKQKLKVLQKDLDEGLFNHNDIDKYKYNKRKVQYMYNKGVELSLFELFERFKSYRFGDENESGIHGYKTFGTVLKSCPQQDFATTSNQWEIVDYIQQNRKYSTVQNVLSVIDRAVGREKAKGNLPDSTPNIFRKALADFLTNNKKASKKYPLMLTQRGFIKDPDKKAWTVEEVGIILSAWSERQKNHSYYRRHDVTATLLEFLFDTGVRHGEAFGLRWNALSDDLLTALIHKSFSTSIRKLKETKTTKTRKIKLNKEIRAYLQQLKEFYIEMGMPVSPGSYIFMKSNQEPFVTGDISRIWRGRSASDTAKHKEVIGLVPQLVLDGELRSYIDPYSTRRTFISIEAQSGVDPKTVADIVGDNVETILKHYYQGREDHVPTKKW